MLGLIGSLRFFGYFSTLVQLFIFICLAAISFESFKKINPSELNLYFFEFNPFTFSSILSAISLAIFTIEGIFLMFPIRSNFIKSNR